LQVDDELGLFDTATQTGVLRAQPLVSSASGLALVDR
jgi:hypothetical protein